MTKNAPTKTVSVTCACGVQFDREVKRGRPQVWCPTCLAIPFYERTAAAPTVTETGEVVEARPARPFDDLGHVREQVEADVAAFYAEWPKIKATLPADADPGHQMALGLQAVYARYRK